MTKHKLKDGDFSEKQKETLKEFRVKKRSLTELSFEDKSVTTITDMANEVHGYAHAIRSVVEGYNDYLLFHELIGSTPISPCQHFDFSKPILSAEEFLTRQYNHYFPQEQAKK